MGFWSPLHDVNFVDLIMVISNEKARNLCLFVIRISRELFIRSTSQLAGLLPRTRGSTASNLVHVTPIASRATMLTSAALEHLYHWVVWSSLESNNVTIHILNYKYQMCLIPSGRSWCVWISGTYMVQCSKKRHVLLSGLCFQPWLQKKETRWRWLLCQTVPETNGWHHSWVTPDQVTRLQLDLNWNRDAFFECWWINICLQDDEWANCSY